MLTTADYALLISLFSLALSLLGFIWNVWSKFLYPKPRVRISVALVLFDDAKQQLNFFPQGKQYLPRLGNDFLSSPVLRIYASNSGPGEVKLGIPIAARGRPNGPRAEGYAQFSEFVKYPHMIQLSSKEAGLEQSLKPSEDIAVYVPTSKEELDALNPIRIGFFDSFGRKHFCRRSEVRHLRKVAQAYFERPKSEP